MDLTYLPADLAHKLPKQPIPAVLIGRLACAIVKGNGMVKMLLMDALKRTLAVDSLRLFLPLKSL